MNKVKIINWNILAECMRKFLKEDPKDLTKDHRQEMIIKILTQLIQKNPDAIIALQEVSLIEEEKILALLKDYVVIRRRPSTFSENPTFWSGEQRQEMSVLLAVPPSSFLNYNSIRLDVVDLVKELPKQDEEVVYPEFCDVKGKGVGHSTYDELMKRTSLAAIVELGIDDERIGIIVTHDPCVFYMPEFQALIGECKKNLARKLNADYIIFVGDWNLNKWLLKGEQNLLWTHFVRGISCASLLPQKFKGVTIFSAGNDDPRPTDITNRNGEFASNLCHAVVFFKTLKKSIYPLYLVFSDFPTGLMDRSGPNLTFSSDHVPVIFSFTEIP
jgi:hypothetical protein